MATEKKKGPATVKVLKDYFGLKPGQGLKGFAEELRELTPEDRQQLANGIQDESYNY